LASNCRTCSRETMPATIDDPVILAEIGAAMKEKGVG
jgi:hypothetical protein